MKKKDIEHIKRNFKHNNDALLVHGIGIYHVSDDKKVSGKLKRFCELRDMNNGKSGSENYWDLAEENRFFEIMKKSISGSIGQTLEEYKIEEYSDMKKIIDSNLDKGVAESYAEYIANKLNLTGSYAIVLAVCELSEVSKDSRGWNTKDDDLCETDVAIHKFLITSICPMNTINISLYFDRNKRQIEHWEGIEKEVGLPAAAFIYPAIEDGYVFDSHVMVYNKDKNNPLKSLVVDVLGSIPKITSKEQKKVFEEILDMSLKNEESKTIKEKKEIKAAVKEKVKELSTIAAETGDKGILDENTVKNIFVSSGITESVAKEAARKVESKKDENVILSVENIVHTPKKKYQHIAVNIPEGKIELLKQVIGGKECLVIPIDDYEIKGI